MKVAAGNREGKRAGARARAGNGAGLVAAVDPLLGLYGNLQPLSSVKGERKEPAVIEGPLVGKGYDRAVPQRTDHLVGGGAVNVACGGGFQNDGDFRRGRISGRRRAGKARLLPGGEDSGQLPRTVGKQQPHQQHAAEPVIQRAGKQHSLAEFTKRLVEGHRISG